MFLTVITSDAAVERVQDSGCRMSMGGPIDVAAGPAGKGCRGGRERLPEGLAALPRLEKILALPQLGLCQPKCSFAGSGALWTGEHAYEEETHQIRHCVDLACQRPACKRHRASLGDVDLRCAGDPFR